MFVASTSEVYGKSSDAPVPARTATWCWAPTYKGRWSYACSKAIDEFLALAYWKERGLPTVVAPPVQHGRPAPDRPVRHGRPELRQPGARRTSRSRSTATARRRAASATSHDVVRALAELMETRGLYGQVFNIGTPGGDLDRATWPSRSASSRGSTSRDPATSPTRRPTRPASRTCCAACPTSTKISARSAGARRSARRDHPRRAQRPAQGPHRDAGPDRRVSAPEHR